MEPITETLDTPLLLVAMPQVHDGYFDHSVVLLMQHDQDGSLGLIVNKPSELTVSEVVSPLGVEWGGAPDAMVWFGGPVASNLGTLLLREQDVPAGAAEKALPVAPDLRMVQDVDMLRTLAARPPESLRLLLGYAGWSAGQLEQEIERSDWLIVPYDADLVLGVDADATWIGALRSIGVRPESLPSFNTGSYEHSN